MRPPRRDTPCTACVEPISGKRAGVALTDAVVTSWDEYRQWEADMRVREAVPEQLPRFVKGTSDAILADWPRVENDLR